MSEALRATGAPLVYGLSAIAFILGLTSIKKVRTARRGPPLIGLGLCLAVVGVVFEVGTEGLWGFLPVLVGGGLVGGLFAARLPVTAAPARVAWIPALAGAAAAAAALGVLEPPADPIERSGAAMAAVASGASALLLGLGLTFGGKNTPRSSAAAALVVVLSGWATLLVGFALTNVILVIIGGVVGTAGIALGRIVGTASSQPFLRLVLGGVDASEHAGYTNVRSCSTEEAAMMLETADQVVIIPGFGMAGAQAQHAVHEMAEQLEKHGAKVIYAVHPTAGCVPGHMNIMLDEANVPRHLVVSTDAAGPFIKDADAIVVVGANDVVNPATSDTTSAVYGMEAPDLSAARTIFVIKRSLRPGARGVKNALFEQPNTTMIFGDAKRVMQSLVAELKGGAH
jgi:NAD(P) transhydrogenase subunit beta